MVQTFEPLRIHSSPSRTAVVSAPATSEPPLGSDSNCIQSSSPLRIAGRWRSFCSSVPNSSSTAAHGANVGAWIRNGIGEARQLLVERRLVRRREALTAVLAGKQMPANPASKNVRCRARAAVDLGELLVVGVPRPQLADSSDGCSAAASP